MSRPAGIGIDAGSTSCKLVAAGPDGEIVDSILEPAHPRIEAQVDSLLEQLTARLGPIDDIPRAATGYGRAMVPCADRRVTEITCHARGVFRSLQRPGTLVDIGGQDAKVIRIGPEGRPEDFAMNDKCAAGTGRFLEHTAGRLGVEITDLGPRALAAEAEERITSTCTVFAESEIISLVAHGAEVDAILRGLHRSLVDRIVALIHSIGWTTPVLLSGGVALNDAVRVMLGEALAEPVRVANRPQLTGAHGAALLAIEG